MPLIRSRNEVYMSKKIETNQKHMTQDNRVVIEKGLDAFKPLSTIAAELGKDTTTISKEIKKHRAFQEHNKFNELLFLQIGWTSELDFFTQIKRVGYFRKFLYFFTLYCGSS